MKAVEVEDLSYTYPDGTLALEGISFSLNKGESLAVLGPNGAGKSTLLRHLNGLLLGNGCVCIMGVEILESNLRWIRSQVGLVFQDPDDQLFMPTLEEDVAFGPINMGLSEEEVQERVKWALEAVGLATISKRCPHHLSFGQRKKAALAAVLSMRPMVLVLDEPTANLDPRSKNEVISLIRALQMNGTTIIIATHDVDIVPLIADKVLLLNRKMISFGNVREILIKKELLRNLELETPVIADLFFELMNDGKFSGEIPFTKEEAISVLLNIIQKR
ncbi:MAG: ATP-binding cassette domain-containing protein [Candidatus Methanosuratincola petrocarbonis]